MSLSKLEEVTCPCGEIFEAELWNSIDAVKDPELKEQLLCGEINVVFCPQCHQLFYAEHFILYNDTFNEILAFVYPSSFADQKEYWHKKMDEDFTRAMQDFSPEDRLTYRPILLFGLDALVALVQDFDEELDESTVLRYIADDLGLSVISLHPYRAYQQQFPRLLPYYGKNPGSMRLKVLEGLEMLLKHNDQLCRYAKVRDHIQKDVAWELDQGMVKTETKSAGTGPTRKTKKVKAKK